MDPLLAAALKRFGVWWLENRPFSKEKREARRERRRRRREGLPPTEETQMDKLTQFLAKYRTSTKAGAAGLVIPALVLLPFYDQVNGFLTKVCSDGDGPLAALVAAGVTWVTMYLAARASKSPDKPGVL